MARIVLDAVAVAGLAQHLQAHRQRPRYHPLVQPGRLGAGRFADEAGLEDVGRVQLGRVELLHRGRHAQQPRVAHLQDLVHGHRQRDRRYTGYQAGQHGSGQFD